LFAGTGGFTADAVVFHGLPGAALFAGVGRFVAAAAHVPPLGAATFAGKGKLTATSNAVIGVKALLAGDSQLHANATVIFAPGNAVGNLQAGNATIHGSATATVDSDLEGAVVTVISLLGEVDVEADLLGEVDQEEDLEGVE
jgi:hypothetical protein